MLSAQHVHQIAKFAHHLKFAMNVKMDSIVIAIINAKHAVVNVQHVQTLIHARAAIEVIIHHQKIQMFVLLALKKDVNYATVMDHVMIA